MEELKKLATSPIQTSSELKRSNSSKKIVRSGSPRASSQATELKSRFDSYRKDKTPPKDGRGNTSARIASAGLPRTASTRNARSVSPRSKTAGGPSTRTAGGGTSLINRVSSKGSMSRNKRPQSTPIARKGDDDFHQDLAIEVIPSGDPDKELDIAKLTEIYNATLVRYGTKDLKKRSFAVLIKKCRPYLEVTHVPSDSDLYSAFDIADLNDDGKVDLDEFIQFCTMLHNAEKNGFDTSDNISMAYQKQKDLLQKGRGKKLTGVDLLAQRNRSTSPRARSPRLTKNASMSESGTSPNPGTALMRKQNSMSPRLQRKGSFKAGDQEGTDYVTTSDTLAYANDEWTTRTSNGSVTKAVELGNYATLTESYSRSVALRKSQEDLRDDMSKALSKAKEDFNKRISKNVALRGHSGTGFDRLGSFSNLTVTSKTQKDAETPHAEEHLRSRRKSREDISRDLALANDDWTARSDAGTLSTKPDELGSFAKLTISSNNKDDVEMSHAEEHLRSRRKSREDLSQDLALAKEAWDERREKGTLNTQPDELGKFARLTISSKNRGDDLDTPDSEQHILNIKNGRNLQSKHLALASEEWKQRREKGELSTQPDELGGFAKATKTSGNKEDLQIGAGENIINMRLNGRNEAAEQLAIDKQKWLDRQEKNELFTIVADLGSFANPTKSWQNKDNQDGHVGAGENIKLLQLNSRNDASNELSKAKEEWLKRQEEDSLQTKMLSLGNYAAPTMSSIQSEYLPFMQDMTSFVWGESQEPLALAAKKASFREA